MAAVQNAENDAQLIFKSGPLTRAEIKKLPNDKAFEYFQVMTAFLRELGAEQFAARREELREAVLRKIVNRT